MPEKARNAFLRQCEAHILQHTGFTVVICVKQHAHFLRLLADTVDAIALHNVSPELLTRPNCILSSLWHLSSAEVKAKVLSMISDTDSSQHAYAQERRHRTYKQCIEVLGLSLQPFTRWSHKGDGAFLLHSESNGSPHCVAMTVSDDEVYILDGAVQYKLGRGLLSALVHKATDFSTLVVFRVSEGSENATELDEALSCLLDLQAGAANSSNVGDAVLDTSDSESCEKEHVLDEGKVFFQDTLQDSLTEEEASFLHEVDTDNIRKLEGMYRCPFCPFRSFVSVLQAATPAASSHFLPSLPSQTICLFWDEAAAYHLGPPRCRLHASPVGPRLSALQRLLALKAGRPKAEWGPDVHRQGNPSFADIMRANLLQQSSSGR